MIESQERRNWGVFWGCGVVIACTMAATAWAGTPVFDYQFPASFDGTTNVVTDLSAAGNNAMLDNDPLMGKIGYAPNERPPGFISGGSLYGADGGYGATAGRQLLANSQVAAHGGFTYDAWIKPMAYDTQPCYIEYANTEYLSLSRTGADPDYVYRFRFAARNGWWNVYSDPIDDLEAWYHVRVSFDSVGLPAFSTDEQPGLAVMVVENPTAGTSNTHYAGMVKTVYGDNFDRQIGINRNSHNVTGNISQGYLFNPKVSLGPDPTIDASSLIPPPAGAGRTVAHWALNEPVGATTIVDSGPNGLNGGSLGEVTFAQAGAAGYSGTAVGFNLDLGSNDYIDVPRDELLNSESFSVALWLKPMADRLAGTAWQIPIDNRGAGTTGWSLTIGPAGATYNNQIYAMIGAGPASWSRMLSNPLEGDEWVHVTMTYDADTDFGRLYVDGELASMVVTDYVRNEVNPLRLGRHNFSESYPYSGDLDDVWLFDYALTEEQIVTLVNDGTPPVSTRIPGDATGDGRVDDEDAAMLAANWGVGSATWAMGDFNGDGKVDAIDASIMAAHWGHGVDGEATAVPEPSLLALLLVLPWLCFCRQRWTDSDMSNLA